MSARRALAGLLLIASLAAGGAALARQASPQFQCSASSGYGAMLEQDQYFLDLQCQPALATTIVLEPNEGATFTVSLSNWYAAVGMADAEFDIHLAMDRARIALREAGSADEQIITDVVAAMADVRVITDQTRYVFTIENRGLRSAVFDLSLRPR
ncbi:MAG: hypothetical protein KME04_05570 [Pleurocapsa minor GSE-CHR-MK-17-07R]|jgi:hypothetical protein|nr:hypothetical protein [Pleurocapsa minor GSE-CHR-MK 17-07R]